MRAPALALPLVLLLALTGCARGSLEPSPSATPTFATATDSRTKVDWENYSPDAQRLIDEDQAASDCEMLQGAFDVADNADGSQRDRTGDGNADLMKYIDEAMRLGGCYE